MSSVNINYLKQMAPVGKVILKKSAFAAWYLYVGAIIAVAIDSTAETISSLSPKDKSKEDHAPKKTTAN